MERKRYKEKIKEWKNNKIINCYYCDGKVKCSICGKKISSYIDQGDLKLCFNDFINQENFKDA